MKNITFRILFLLGLTYTPFIGFSQVNSPNNTHTNPEIVETFVAKLRAQHIFQAIQKQTGATKEELQMFLRFYKDSIAVRDRSVFQQAVLHGKIKTDADVKAFADKKIPQYIAMYNRFEILRKIAPSTIEDYLSKPMPPIACLTGCNNLDFENGSLSNWTACYASNVSTSSSLATSAFTCFGPLGAVTTAAYDPATSSNQVSLTSGAGFDPIAGALIPVVAPGGGSYSCMVGDATGTLAGVSRIEQTFMITAGQPNLTYMYAVLLENPPHPYFQQPYFQIELLDQNGNDIPGCGQYYIVSGPALPGYTAIYYPTNTDTVYAKPWSTEFIPLSNYIGTCVTLRVTSSDCAQGAHFGYGYFDALCSPQAVITSSPAICGANNVTLTAPPGAQAYKWIGPCIVGPNTNQTVSVNCAGTYSVVLISDMKNPCPDTIKITINASPVLNFNLVSTTNVKCNGANTGSATVLATGGTAPYTYSWNPANGTNATATGLSAGTYTAYAQDNAGCKDSLVFTITQPTALTAPTSSTPATCSANNGTATVTAGGGTPAYTYSWAPTGGTTANATGLSAGTYTITVTDNNGCTITATAIVANTGALNVTTTTVGVLCNGGSTGSATATPAGGTAPYTYTWTPVGGSNAIATGLSAGTYTISVTDANGCNGTATATVTEPPVITAPTSATQTTCGGNSGTTTVTAGGGTPGYTYSWAPGGQTNATATGLSAGTYTITVTDANGCTQTATAAVTTTGGLTVTAIPTNILCNGDSTGSAIANIVGGTAPFTYTWTPVGGTNATATGLGIGTYTVSVTDKNGCSGTASATITQPTPLTATATATQTTCAANTGTATANPGGGTPGYTYVWTPGGQTNVTATALSAGIYTVTVTDANGCTQTASASVTTLGGETVSISASTNITCNGANNGSATSTVVGGTAPYTYAWTPAGGTNATATGLSAGVYTITVTDNNGCISFTTVTITEPPLLTATISSTTNIVCNGQNTGSLTVTAGGGTPNYTYLWAPAGGNATTANGLSAGSYTVTVTDANGCTASAIGTITQPTALTANISATVNITCFGLTNGSIAVNAAGGTPAYTYSWAPSGGTAAIASGLSAGTYTINVTDANGCTATASGTITQPTALTAAITNTGNVTCFGNSDGTLTVTPAGGSPAYTYAWAPSGGNAATATNLSAGTYTITITDANGCSATTSGTVTQPTKLTVTASGPAIACSGLKINLSSTPAGGTGPYTFAWTPAGGAIQNPTVLIATTTTYTVTVTDANNCTAFATVTVATGPALTAVVTGAKSFCPGGSASLSVTASGGTGAYTYLWIPGNNSSQSMDVNPTSTTTYNVQVTDGCGTVINIPVTVTVNPSPTVSFLANPNTGCAPLCVQFRDLSSIGNGRIANWIWNFGDGDSLSGRNPIHCYKDTGSFNVTLTATSDSGCSSTLDVLKMVTVYAHPNANFTYSPQPVNIESPLVQFTDQSTSKYPLVFWNWTFGDGSGLSSTLRNPSHQYSDTGTYCATLVITDMHGCMDSITNCLVVNPLFTLYIPDAFSPNGDGINDVFTPKGSYIKDFEMYIFDRWGMKLFHTGDIMNGWNGKVLNNATVCQEDTYVYQIYVTDTQGNKHAYNGKVTLLK